MMKCLLIEQVAQAYTLTTSFKIKKPPLIKYRDGFYCRYLLAV